jgi:cytochrome c oxidase subunit 2
VRFGAVAGAVALLAVVVLVTLAVLGGSDDGEVAQVDPTARELGCTSCHTVDGRRSEGPTWQGLWGSEVTLVDGSVVTADEEYLRRAILDPAADVREGYTAAMPLVEVTDEQLEALLAHLEELAA